MHPLTRAQHTIDCTTVPNRSLLLARRGFAAVGTSHGDVAELEVLGAEHTAPLRKLDAYESGSSVYFNT